jgi:hypothetical protein
MLEDDLVTRPDVILGFKVTRLWDWSADLCGCDVFFAFREKVTCRSRPGLLRPGSSEWE